MMFDIVKLIIHEARDRVKGKVRNFSLAPKSAYFLGENMQIGEHLHDFVFLLFPKSLYL